MCYGLTFDWIAIGNLGGVRCVAPDALMSRTTRVLEGDAYHCVSRARFLGKWLGNTTSTETTMALWGIRP